MFGRCINERLASDESWLAPRRFSASADRLRLAQGQDTLRIRSQGFAGRPRFTTSSSSCSLGVIPGRRLRPRRSRLPRVLLSAWRIPSSSRGWPCQGRVPPTAVAEPCPSIRSKSEPRFLESLSQILHMRIRSWKRFAMRIPHTCETARRATDDIFRRPRVLIDDPARACPNGLIRCHPEQRTAARHRRFHAGDSRWDPPGFIREVVARTTRASGDS